MSIDAAETVRRMAARLHDETLKRGQVAAIKAFTAGLHGADLRAALKTEAYYDRALNRAVLDFYRGDIEAGEFIDEMIRLIEEQFNRAWNEGAREMGVDPKTFSDEDRQELQDRIDRELEFVLDFAQDIEEAKIKGNPVAPLQARVPMWARRYNDVMSDARTWFGAQERFEWIYGDTDHCNTCAELNGIVATGQAWQDSDWRPQGENLDCHGFRCQCRLDPTKKPATDKQPGDVSGG